MAKAGNLINSLFGNKDVQVGGLVENKVEVVNVGISVIIPVRNPSIDEIERTVISLSNQTKKDFQTVFVVDGDDSKNKIEKIIDSYKLESVLIVSVDKNVGPATARNIGISAATNEVICHMNIGDIYDNEYILVVYKAFSGIPNCAFLMSSFSIMHPEIGEQEFNVPQMINRFPKRDGQFPELEIIFSRGGLAPAMAVAHSKILFHIVGGFQDGIKSGEEAITWRRMATSVNPECVIFADFSSGCHYYQETDTNKEFKSIEVEYSDELGHNGQYLDELWYTTNSSWSGEGE